MSAGPQFGPDFGPDIAGETAEAPAAARAGAAAPVLLRLAGVTKGYRTGATEVRALDGVDLTVRAGEFVAIMGQSGSGKSTLMHILGCLDRPSSGDYAVAGRAVAGLSADELATLRRDTFGFVFQRYNLMATATAAENVEIPAIYAGAARRERAERALRLLDRLGLGERARHRPGELSGGQQQRVSIARALMNDPPVILADEPTGALDSRSGEEVMALLRDLHAEGRTILLITHDAEVASHAERIVQIRDGRIVDDRVVARAHGAARPETVAPHPERRPVGLLAGFAEAVKMALRSLRVNIFRTALTLLGVVIGVGAVVTMLAVGEGSQREVMERIQSMGTNLLVVRPGGPGIRNTGDRATLVQGDAEALKGLPGIEAVSPERRGTATLRFGNIDYRTTIQGVWPDYLQARDWALAAGGFIVRDDVRSYAPVIVLGDTVAKNLFPGGDDPIGRYVLVGNVPFEVVGVLRPKGASAFGSDQDDVAAVPLTTGIMRIFGRPYLSMITVKVADAAAIPAVEASIRETLLARHRIEDFQVRNTASLLEAAEETQGTLTALLGSVAAISLLVGGIGVMNIMLVSVTERTREIGVRMATGARMRDILLQFNTEALVVCGIGGLIGVAAGVGVGLALRAFGVSVEFTEAPALLAFACAFATGVLFGYLPARKAASLDPVVALSAE